MLFLQRTRIACTMLAELNHYLIVQYDVHTEARKHVFAICLNHFYPLGYITVSKALHIFVLRLYNNCATCKDTNRFIKHLQYAQTRLTSIISAHCVEKETRG